MAKLAWDMTGERIYETGTKNGVLYPMTSAGVYGTGVAWNGLSGVTESPSGAEENSIYADDIKYLALRSAETFGATIEAYTYPDEWSQCDGSYEVTPGVMAGQQKRKPFGLVYKTIIGNDTELDAHGYKLHLIYNATASPSERAYQTVNDSPEAVTFSWEVSTTPVAVSTKDADGQTLKPVSCITIDSTKVDAEALEELEDMLFGTDANGTGGAGTSPTLPSPDTVFGMF